MAKRVLSGLIILAVLAAVVMVNLVFPFGMNLIIGILSAWMVYELCEVFHLNKDWFYLAPSMAFAFGLPLISNHYWYATCCGAYLFVMVALALFFHEKLQFTSWASATGLILMITLAMSTMVGIRDHSGVHGSFNLFIVFMASWVADAGAYFAGSFFGKHKLCPKLSPKKTIEGVGGGFFLNVLAMLVYGTAYNLIFFGGKLSVSYLSLVIIGLACTIVSIVGDLFFSFIKRSFDIKDYGHIIPGHGGFLDRFDSTIFVAPFLYFFLQLLPMIHPVANTVIVL